VLRDLGTLLLEMNSGIQAIVVGPNGLTGGPTAVAIGN
jgi:hypothetical protein